MNERTILDLISVYNPWWNGVKHFPIRKIHPFKRRDYFYIKDKEVSKGECSLIIGPRGVGKSTVLFELMRELLGLSDNINESGDFNTINGIDPKRVLFVSFEESRLQKTNIFDLIKIYSKYVLSEDISKIKDKVYIFFDEIQEVNNWGSQIKAIHDLDYNIKLSLSGSSSVSIKDEASKAARRLSLYSMLPLKFSDFLHMKSFNEDNFTDVLDKVTHFRKDFLIHLKNNDAQNIYDSFMKLYLQLSPWKTNIEIFFDEYRIKGGYPALVNCSDYSLCASMLRDTFWLGFHKDLMIAKGIGDPSGMRALAEYIASISSCETNYKKLREKSGATKNTEQLRKYLYHLENAYLVQVSNRFGVSPTRRDNVFKIYLCDIAIRNMLQGMYGKILYENERELGLATETLVFDHLLRLFFKIRPFVPLSYTKDEAKGREVDIILKLNGVSLPVEVKKSDEPYLAGVAGLQAFCAKHKNIGFVSCGKKLSFENGIIFLPHWLFMLIC